MAHRRRVVITGMGWVTPLGSDLQQVWSAILEARSGVGPISTFDASAFPTTFAAQVKDFDFAQRMGPDHPAHANAARQVQFALAAARDAWHMAGLPTPYGPDPARAGVYLGSGEGPVDFDGFVNLAMQAWSFENRTLDYRAWATHAREHLHPAREFEQDPNLAAARLARLFGLAGPNLNTLTACAASNQAIGEATMQIRRGDADLILAGGCHSMIHPFGVTGFNRLTALSRRNDTPQTASRPFDLTRDGFVLGEGAGMVVLEDLDHARARNAPIHAEIAGFGTTADAYRITDIHESARGGSEAMRQALADAGLQPAQIDYINAHGTGTQENDRLESLAIRNVFGEHARRIPVSSIKSMLGHLIAAAGAVEAIACVLAIREGVLPPTGNYATPDPACDLDYIPNAPRRAEVHRVLTNNFGFGGQNDTLILQRFID